MKKDRRSDNRQSAKDYYRAEIRLVGVPVHEVRLKDLSSQGACVLILANSSLLKHLQVEQDLAVKFFLGDRSKPSEKFHAKIKHITQVKEGRFKGFFSAGLSIR